MGGFQLQIALKSKKVIQKRKKSQEIRKVARRTKSCSKSEKLLKVAEQLMDSASPDAIHFFLNFDVFKSLYLSEN